MVLVGRVTTKGKAQSHGESRSSTVESPKTLLLRKKDTPPRECPEIDGEAGLEKREKSGICTMSMTS